MVRPRQRGTLTRRLARASPNVPWFAAPFDHATRKLELFARPARRPCAFLPSVVTPDLFRGDGKRAPLPNAPNFPTRPKSALPCRMKRYPRKQHRRPDHRRVPAFSPVPTRTRTDGWTPARQAAFLGALAETRSVSAATRKVRMARETAYRLRKLRGAESFSAAWDAVLGRVTPGRRKVTAEERARRAIEGLLKPVMYRGKHVAIARKADNSALLGHLAQFDRAALQMEQERGRSQRVTGGLPSLPPIADE